MILYKQEVVMSSENSQCARCGIKLSERLCLNDQVRPAKSRIEETIEFARRMQYRKLGLAFCVGLRKEARVVEKLFSGAGFEVVSACWGTTPWPRFITSTATIVP